MPVLDAVRLGVCVRLRVFDEVRVKEGVKLGVREALVVMVGVPDRDGDTVKVPVVLGVRVVVLLGVCDRVDEELVDGVEKACGQKSHRRIRWAEGAR